MTVKEAIAKLPFKLPPALSQPSITKFQRALIRVSGSDAEKFLQGLTTNDTRNISPYSGQYSALLSPQGRVLYDGFIWRFGASRDDYLIDVDKRIGGDLILHLRQYQLRSKLAINDASDDHFVQVKWNHTIIDDTELSMIDPRANLTIMRSVKQGAINTEDNSEALKTIRFAFGIAEGPEEIPRSQAIPLEYNLDWLHAIDYHKGCYLGQELVARTHYRGMVRKRIMPFWLGEDQVFNPCLESSNVAGTEIFGVGMDGTEERIVGKVIATHGNLGLAMIRLEEAASFPSCRIPLRSLPVKIMRPHWWSDN